MILVDPETFAMAFYPIRRAAPADLALAEGVELERIPALSDGRQPGIALVHRNWSRLYFVLKREGWTEDDYFAHAERIMAQRGIKEP